MGDQALVAARRCVRHPCCYAHDGRGALLVPRESASAPGFWTYCCENCGASYGVQPHPDLRDLSAGEGP